MLGSETPVPSLVFKRSRARTLAVLAIREARFYRGVAPMLPRGLAPQCFLAEEEDGAATLLLDDLGRSHRECTEPCPTLDEATAFVEALAELHATGSGRASLPADWEHAIGESAYNTIEGRLGRLDAVLPGFIAAMHDGIDTRTRQLITRISSVPAGLASFAKNQTILHGDAHYWNGLYSSTGAVLLDWGSACLGPGEIDLAHAVAMNLPREIGRQWEAPLLDAYCRRLNECGVSRSIEDVRARYVFGVLYAVTVPIGQWRGGFPEEVWRPLFTNVVAAGRDLDVESLL
jgi:aminoglycoside phosphotransferase (APT) family kinase protein